MKINDRMKIGNLEVDGRVIMPPMGTYKCDEDGFVTDEVIEYYRERAKNPNVALIITEHAYIDKLGKAKDRQMSIAEDDKIEGLTKLVDAIHTEGVKAIAQLNFGGEPNEMTKADIEIVVQRFVEAARRAKSAGYDGIEIHSAHAYLLNQFYSPLANKRTDEYGGNLENRLRIHREVLRAVRTEVGDDYPISVRLGGYDDAEGGNTLADAVQAAKIIAAEGVELLSLTGGMCRYIRKGHTEPGYFGDMAVAIRKEVDAPVLLTGGIKTLDDAEKLVQNEVTDFVGVGRPLLGNANWEM